MPSKKESSKKELVRKLKKEVEKNFFLTVQNREFLMSHAESLPAGIIRKMLESLKEHNKKVQKYIEIAIDNNPRLAIEMKTKAKQLKQKILKLRESEEQTPTEETLEKELGNI